MPVFLLFLHFFLLFTWIRIKIRRHLSQVISRKPREVENRQDNGAGDWALNLPKSIKTFALIHLLIINKNIFLIIEFCSCSFSKESHKCTLYYCCMLVCEWCLSGCEACSCKRFTATNALLLQLDHVNEVQHLLTDIFGYELQIDQVQCRQWRKIQHGPNLSIIYSPMYNSFVEPYGLCPLFLSFCHLLLA